MFKRVVSALAGMGIIFFVIAIQPYFNLAINIGFAVVILIAIYEIINTIGFSKQMTILIPSFILGGVLPFANKLSEVRFPIAQLTIYGYILIVLCHSIFMYEKVKFTELAETIVMVMMVTFAFSSIAFTSEKEGRNSIYLLFYILGSAWFADIGAYFVGVFFGKHKLAPVISPKKTVEGFIGGIVSTPIFLILMTLLYKGLFNREVQINYLTIIALGIITSLISVLGDLTFSIIKRHYNVKDYGNIMPGHGGIMDRFDSVTFVAPFLYFILPLFPIFA